MRAGSGVAPGNCGCNLCLVIGRLLSICHCGDLGPAPVAFATDRLRVLYSELLDICARGPLLQSLVRPPPVAAGEGPRPPLASPRVGGVGEPPPERSSGESAEVKKEAPIEKKEEESSTLPLAKAEPPAFPAPTVLLPPPPPVTGTTSSSSARASVPKQPEGLVSKVVGACPPKETPVPVKARPCPPDAPPPVGKASSAREAPAAKETKTEEGSDEYTYETVEQEEEKEEVRVEEPAPVAGSREERSAEDTELAADSSQKRSKSKKRRGGRGESREAREDKKEKKEKKPRSRSRRRERRHSRDRRQRSPSAPVSRARERPRSPVGPPPWADKGEGKGQFRKKSKGKVREQRWQDIQTYGPSKHRKKRREEGQGR